MLHAESIRISAGDKPLVTDRVVGDSGREVGLVGPSGAGKTAHNKSIAGRHSLDEGSVLVRPRTRVGYRQSGGLGHDAHRLRGGGSHMDGEPTLGATAACEAAGAGGGPSAEELSALDNAGVPSGGGRPTSARLACSTAGFAPDDQQRPCSASRAAGRCDQRGAAQADLLLLDEPSNHLDASARAWLVGYLREYAGSSSSSHDEACSTCGVRREVARGRLHTYKGGYALLSSATRCAEAAATLDKQQRQAEKLQGFVDKWGAQATKRRRPTR